MKECNYSAFNYPARCFGTFHAKIPRHTSKNPIAEGNFYWIFAHNCNTHKVSGANKNSINLMKRVALKDMRDVRELLFENSRKEKTLKRFLEYCYMIDVKVALEGLNGEKTRGLKAAVKYVKEHDIGMTEEQIHAVYCVRYHILPLHVGI